MADLDRATARALVEAGYMPLSYYIELFGELEAAEAEFPEASLIPAVGDEADVVQIGGKDRVRHQ